MSTIDLTPLYRTMVGFDRLAANRPVLERNVI